MPRTAEQNAHMRSVRREQLLQAAIPIFARMGFAEASMGAIAIGARASYGTVFLYFPTKEELFRAAVLEPLPELEQMFSIGIPEGASPRDIVRHMVRTQVSYV